MKPKDIRDELNTKAIIAHEVKHCVHRITACTDVVKIMIKGGKRSVQYNMEIENKLNEIKEVALQINELAVYDRYRSFGKNSPSTIDVNDEMIIPVIQSIDEIARRRGLYIDVDQESFALRWRYIDYDRIRELFFTLMLLVVAFCDNNSCVKIYAPAKKVRKIEILVPIKNVPGNKIWNRKDDLNRTSKKENIKLIRQAIDLRERAKHAGVQIDMFRKAGIATVSFSLSRRSMYI